MNSVAPLSLRHTLRDATAVAHARVDALLRGGLHDRNDHVTYVRAMHAFVGIACQVRPERDDWRTLRAALDDDMRTLALAPLPPVDVAPAADGDARIGWDYVVAGASMGAQLLYRQAQALGFDAAHGGAFLALHAAQGRAWPQVVARLDALDPAAIDVDRACAAARDAFHHAEHAFRIAQDTAV